MSSVPTIPANLMVLLPEIPAGKSPKHDIHKYRDIIKLTEDNWVNWKFSIVAALQERGLWEITLGYIAEIKATTDTSGAITNQDKINLWRDMDTSARTQIIQNLSPGVQVLVLDCEHATDTWYTLLDEFESKNLDCCAALRREYDNLPHNESTSLRDYLT
jgi:hypothetical protein